MTENVSKIHMEQYGPMFKRFLGDMTGQMLQEQNFKEEETIFKTWTLWSPSQAASSTKTTKLQWQNSGVGTAPQPTVSNSSQPGNPNQTVGGPGRFKTQQRNHKSRNRKLCFGRKRSPAHEA